MEKEIFLETLVAGLEEKTGMKFKVEETECGDEPCTFVFPLIEGDFLSLSLWADLAYENCMSGQKALETVVEEAAEKFLTLKKSADCLKEQLEDYDKVKKRLFIRALPSNIPYEGDQPYKKMADLRGDIFACMGEEEMAVCFYVTNRHLRQWGISFEDAWAQAQRNTEVSMYMENYGQFLYEQGANLLVREIPGVYIVRTKAGIFGAGAVFCSELSELLAPLGECFILPVSLHDVFIVQDDDASKLKSLTEDFKLTPAERLSDRVYRFRNGRLWAVM